MTVMMPEFGIVLAVDSEFDHRADMFCLCPACFECDEVALLNAELSLDAMPDGYAIREEQVVWDLADCCFGIIREAV